MTNLAKKIAFVSFVFCLGLSQSFALSPYFAHATSYTNFAYARVETDDVYLYKTTALSSEGAVLFEVPKSYFVLLLANVDENFYRAQYRDEVGFVLKSDVLPVNETPQNPYLESVTFRLFSSDGKNMLSQVDNLNSAKTVEEVSLYQTLDYYGRTLGEELVSDRGNTWYYCKNPSSQNKGYLYAGLCDQLSTLPQNTEQTTHSTAPFSDTDTGYLYNLVDLSNPLKILLVILVVLPSFVIIYLLFKPFKLEKQNLKPLAQTKSKNVQTANKIQKIIDDDDKL